MKNYSLYFLSFIAALAISCSSSPTKSIQDKWWFHVSEHGKDIIKFSSDGKFQNINNDNATTYEVNGDSIKFKLGLTTNTYAISSVTENELVLKNAEDTENFRLATDQDFIVGKWDGTKNGVKLSLYFDKQNKVSFKTTGEDGEDTEEEYTYSFNGNKVIIDNEPIEYTLSADKNNLTLKGKEILNLVRRD